MKSVVISSYKKNTDGVYHRHSREDWTAAQRERRDAFHDAAWAVYFVQPRIPEGTIHLIIGYSLVRVLTRIQAHWQVGALSFSGAAMPADAREGEDIYGYTDDGNQRFVQGRVKKND